MSSKEYQQQYRARNPTMQLVASAKFRAKRDNIEFDLKRSDIFIPAHCPIFGIPLVAGVAKQSDNSPTLDRINPLRGYVKDNVRVISHKANHKKQDNTIEDLELLLRYAKGEL